jgi:hypothetical protein
MCFGLCRNILFNYYLKKYNRIISDGSHNELGGKYWKKLFEEAKKMGYKTYILNIKDESKFDSTEIDKYYGNTSKFLDYRLVIEK